MDSRDSSSLPGYHFKQVLVDDVLVWERDVTADGSNTWYTEAVDITQYCEGKSEVSVKFRLYDKKTLSSYAVDTYWDDFSIIGGDVVNGDFERSLFWRYNENYGAFSGGYSTAYKKSGERSYNLRLPTGTPSANGNYAEVEQSFYLKNPTKYMLNLFTRDSRSGSAAGYHYKQVLIDGVVVWQQDAATDPANQWLGTLVDVTPYVAGKSSITVQLRLYDKNAVTSYGIDTYWDSITITNTDLQNGRFESDSDWNYEENQAAFTGEYTTDSAFEGTQSYKISFPSGTASGNGKYAGISQSCAVIY